MRQLEAELPRQAAPRTVRTAALAGLGTALPAKVVTNADVAQWLDIDGEWIVRRTGIEARRHLERDETLHDLAVEAGAAALADAGIDAADVDLVLVATSSPDRLLPAMSPMVAAALGVPGAAAIDIGAACTGFVAGLSLAAAAVESRRADCVLLIGAEGLSRHVDPLDRKTAIVFGDGAGAAVVVATEQGAGIGPCVLASDGAQSELITAPPGGMIAMDGHATFGQAVRALTEVTPQAVAAAGLELEDIDLFVYHQANRRILTTVGERLGLPAEKVVDAIAQVGNTSAASVPLALAQARSQGLVRPGARILLGAVGAGFTWGATVVEWSAA
jgi:3-oxoacyl-[acyl-carrier-protein] synthase-3